MLRQPRRPDAGGEERFQGGMISARRQFVFRGLQAAQEGKILCNFSVVCLNSPTFFRRRAGSVTPDDLKRILAKVADVLPDPEDLIPSDLADHLSRLR